MKTRLPFLGTSGDSKRDSVFTEPLYMCEDVILSSFYFFKAVLCASF